MAEELLTSILPRPYTGIVSYLSPSSFLTITDFEKSMLACNNWLDLPTSDQHKKGRKCCDPDGVFRVFGDFCDYEPSNVRAEMLSYITDDFNYFCDVSWLNLNMCKKSLSQWITDMRSQNTPADELAIFALSRLYKRHSVIYTKNRTWCTISTSNPLSEKDVYLSCDVRFVQMGPRNFVSLIKKPISCMPVMQFEPLENIYKGGYYDDEPTPPDMGTPSCESDSKETNKTCIDIPEDQDSEKVEYCALHRCKISGNDTIITNDDTNGTHTTEINFPTTIAVCKPSNTSKLNVFNSLEESEPNLDLYMSNQNKDTEQSINDTDSNTKKVITRKCVVRVRNLTQEEIDFLCGPKLLPSFTIESKLLEVETPTESEKQSAEIISHAPIETLEEAVASTSGHGTICNSTNEEKDCVLSVEETPTRILRPRCNAASKVDYSKPEMDDTDSDSTDEYTPNSDKSRTKLDNKKMPSAARMATQKRKYDKPKPHSQPPRSSEITAKKETIESPTPTN